MVLKVEKYLADTIMEMVLPKDNHAWERDVKKFVNTQLRNPSLQILTTWNNDIIRLFIRYVASNFSLEHFENVDSNFQGCETLLLCLNNVLQDGSMRNYSLCLLNYSKTKKRFYFLSDFFNELKTTELKNIRFCDLMQGCGSIRLPSPIYDRENDSFDEFLFFVGSVREFYNLQKEDAEHQDVWEKMKLYSDANLTDASHLWSLAWISKSGSYNFTSMTTKDTNILIQDLYKNVRTETKILTQHKTRILEDGYEPHIKAMFNCLVYLKTGDPDLRSFKNFIRYQSQGSSTPVRKDKSLCQDEITLVGFSFKKLPNYNKMLFYQPPYYARRGTDKRWVWCKGSLKKRRIGNTDAP